MVKIAKPRFRTTTLSEGALTGTHDSKQVFGYSKNYKNATSMGYRYWLACATIVAEGKSAHNAYHNFCVWVHRMPLKFRLNNVAKLFGTAEDGVVRTGYKDLTEGLKTKVKSLVHASAGYIGVFFASQTDYGEGKKYRDIVKAKIAHTQSARNALIAAEAAASTAMDVATA